MNRPMCAERIDGETERWGIFELRLSGPDEGNPFQDVQVSARFQYKNVEIETDGFYDGDGTYKIRFMPDRIGEWRYETRSNRSELDGRRGQFRCVAPSEGNRGPVRVKGDYRFAYEDGTPYMPFGTTCYHWTHAGDERLEEMTLRSLEASPFNKVRMCILPTRAMSPPAFAFAGTCPEDADTTRFNPAFFAHLERRIQDLMNLGVEADLVLFHPYDKGHWGFDDLGRETDRFYLRYVIARLASFRNVWWSMANEYDFMKEKRLEDWDRLIRLAAEEDPYGRLLSIHNGTTMYVPESVVMYDHAKPQITHCSIQHWDVTMVSFWLREYGKPVIVDECGYEGNLPQRWGNLTAEELAHRCWESFARGGYAAHGETYVHPQDEIWWAKGGSLYGTSQEYIRFLRTVAEDAPPGLRPIPVRDVPVIGVEGSYYLHYYGQHRPAYRQVELPDGTDFTAEWIDTRGMTFVRLEGTFRGSCRIPLPGKPYHALRLRAKMAAAT